MGAIVINEQEDQIWLALGDTEILLRCGDGLPKNGMRLVLYCEDAPDDRERMGQCGTKTKDGEAEDAFLVQDADGRWLSVLEQPV